MAASTTTTSPPRITPWRTFPADPAAWYDREQVDKARTYLRPIRISNGIRGGIDLVVMLAVIRSHVVPRLVGDIHGWFLGLVVAVLVLVVVDAVVTTPFAAWRQLSYDKRWGFSTQTPGQFALDQVKAFPLGIVLFTVLFAPLWAVIRWTPAWWLIGWAVFSSVAVTIAVLYPIVIGPLFNKYSPLEEGELRDGILDAARRAGADISTVLVEDTSKRDSRPNAYVAGLGKVRRVVVFDNLLRYPHDGIVAVVAHEIGHWKRHHIARLIPALLVTNLVAFGLLKVVVETRWALDFAGVHRLGDPGALPLFMFVFGLITKLTGLASAWLSRAHERDADLYAFELMGTPRELASTLHDLSVEVLADLAPSWWRRVSASHPPFAERMAMADAWARQRQA